MTDLLPDDSTKETVSTSWLRSGMWGEEDFIELCEVEIDLISEDPCMSLQFSSQLDLLSLRRSGLVTIPLRPISTAQDNQLCLTHLLVTSHPLELPAPTPVADLTEVRCSFQVIASFLGHSGMQVLNATRYATNLGPWQTRLNPDQKWCLGE
jgi:hypothetical protein